MNYVQTLLSLMLLWVKGGVRGESSGVPRPEVVGGVGGVGGGCKTTCLPPTVEVTSYDLV